MPLWDPRYHTSVHTEPLCVEAVTISKEVYNGKKREINECSLSWPFGGSFWGPKRALLSALGTSHNEKIILSLPFFFVSAFEGDDQMCGLSCLTQLFATSVSATC